MKDAPVQIRSDHNNGDYVPYSYRMVSGFFNIPYYLISNKGYETGPLGLYISVYNKCFPLKKVKAIKLNLQKPWLSKGLVKSVRKKNALYKRYLNDPIPENEHIYKKYKNKLNHSLKIAKRLYYVEQIERAKSNLKGTWKILNEIFNRRKSKQRLPSLLRRYYARRRRSMSRMRLKRIRALVCISLTMERI